MSKLQIFLAEARALLCKEISIDVFPEKELRSLIPNFLIHVSVRDLYIPTVGQLFFLQQNKQTDRGNTVYK